MATKRIKSVTLKTEKAIFTVFNDDGTTTMVEASNAVEAVKKAKESK